MLISFSAIKSWLSFEPAIFAVITYWFLAGLVTTLILEARNIESKDNSSGRKAIDSAYRSGFYFATGGFLLPFLAASFIGVVAVHGFWNFLTKVETTLKQNEQTESQSHT